MKYALVGYARNERNERNVKYVLVGYAKNINQVSDIFKQ